MSAAKHTPGPWVIQDNAAAGIHIYSNGGAFGGGLHVARVSNSAGIGYAGQEANARLIASAPDMARELADALDLLVRLHDGCPALTSEALDLLGAHIERMSAVIAKATRA
jgi:hypothetical protein